MIMVKIASFLKSTHRKTLLEKNNAEVIFQQAFLSTQKDDICFGSTVSALLQVSDLFLRGFMFKTVGNISNM
jgi:hypothetical protein